MSNIWQDLSKADYARRPSMDAGMDRRRRVTWIISFTDLMAIMLSFFVLLFAMSAPEPTSLQALSNAVQGKKQGEVLNADQYAGREVVDAAQMTVVTQEAQKLNVDYALSVLREYMKQLPQNTQDSITISKSEKRLVIRGGALLAFEEGESELNADGERLIAGLAPVLSAFDVSIMMIGHAGHDETLTQGRRDTMREWLALPAESREIIMAMKRSSAAARLLLEKGYTGQVLKAAAPESPPRIFQQKNTQNSQPSFPRRVDIVILDTVQ
jgi:chemotaxis protein MotB